MKRTLGLIFVPLFCVDAIDGTKWSDLTAQGEELTQDSKLTLITTENPQEGDQYYGGNLAFQGAKLLTINLTIQQATRDGEFTPIYWKKVDKATKHYFTCAKMQGGEGLCSIVVNINTSKTPINGLLNIQMGTLTLDQNMFFNLTPNGRVKSVFYVGRDGTLEFDGGMKLDLRKQEGTFKDNKIQGKRRVIVEHYGATTKINTYKNPFDVQLYGDIISAGQRFELNLLTKDSVFEGHFDIGDSPNDFSYNDINVSNGASAKIDLGFLRSDFDAPQRFTLNLSNGSSAVLNAIFDRTKYALLDLNVSNSTLYANFSYSQASNQRGDKDTVRIALNAQGRWITTQSGFADEIFFNVKMPDQPDPVIFNQSSKDSPIYPLEFARSGEGGVIDLRFSDFEQTPRKLQNINADNRFVLTSRLIAGEGGIFKIYGLLNRNLWGKDAEGNTIATDLIVTQALKGNHSIQIHWDPDTLDEALLGKDLVGERIVVAKQLTPKLEGNFVGATAPIGLLEYATPLLREEVKDAQGELVGYEWVIGKPSQNATTKPSFLSKTLNTLFAIPYKAFLSQTQTLHQRLGDLKRLDESAGVYFRTNYALLDSKKTVQTLHSLSMYTNITLGADYSFYGGRGSKSFVGASLHITPLQDFGDNNVYVGNSLAYGFSLYGTTLFDNGIYTDVVVAYLYADHQYALNGQEFSQSQLDFASNALIGSFELGYKFRLPIPTPDFDTSFYYLNPRLNLSVGAIFQSKAISIQHQDYSISARFLTSVPTQPSFSLDLGRRFEHPKFFGDVFVSVGAEYTFNAGNPLELSTPFNQGRFELEDIFNLKLGLGANLIFPIGARLYFDMTSKFLGRIASVFNLSAGVRIPLGKRQSNLPHMQNTPIIYGDKFRT